MKSFAITAFLFFLFQYSYSQISPLALKKKQIERKMQAYFNEQSLSDGMEPLIDLKFDKKDLYAKYSFQIKSNIDINALNLSRYNYPPGSYSLNDTNDAPATFLTVQTFTESIDEFLTEYFEPNSDITITITGYTDASPTNGLIYKGEFGFLEQFNLRKGAEIQTNSILGFLRTLGVRRILGLYFKKQKKFDDIKLRYKYFSETQNEETGEIGGSFRKVEIELLIKDALVAKADK